MRQAAGGDLGDQQQYQQPVYAAPPPPRAFPCSASTSAPAFAIRSRMAVFDTQGWVDDKLAVEARITGVKV